MTALTRDIARIVVNTEVRLQVALCSTESDQRELLDLQRRAVRANNALALACEHAAAIALRQEMRRDPPPAGAGGGVAP